MSAETFHRDAFTSWMQQHASQYPLKLYQPAGFLGEPPIGWQLTLGASRVVYRVPAGTPDIFYIVLIERAAERRALYSPLKDLVRLLHLIQESHVGIRWIRGHVEPTNDRPDDALTGERLLTFYRRYLTTVSDGVENGVRWYGGDITAFRWNEEKQKVRAFHRGADAFAESVETAASLT